MTIYHKHHIIPKHAGGTDEPSNLILLTVEEHAEAHRKLYEDHGRWQDLVAYFALSGLISKSEAAETAMKLGREKGGRATKGIRKDPAMQSAKVKNMWKIEGMREHLIEKRKEQSRKGKNPMQGKQQRKACCLSCRDIISVNGLKLHQVKCEPVLFLGGAHTQ